MTTTLKVLRVAKGVSQKQLAAECGCSTTTINRIENNRSDAGRHIRIQLELVFQRGFSELMTPIEELARRGRP